MKKYLFVAGIMCAVAAPVMADDVGVHVGPVGAAVGEHRAHSRTVIKERDPRSKTVIKKRDDMGTREKTVIHHD